MLSWFHFYKFEEVADRYYEVAVSILVVSFEDYEVDGYFQKWSRDYE